MLTEDELRIIGQKVGGTFYRYEGGDPTYAREPRPGEIDKVMAEMHAESEKVNICDHMRPVNDCSICSVN